MVEIYDVDDEHVPLFDPKRLPQKKNLSAKGIKAQRIIRQYTALASGLGLIPLSRFGGQIMISGLLLKLLRDMCRIYGITFSDQQYKILIAGILGGAHYAWISAYLIKFVRNYSAIPHTTATLLLRPAVSGYLIYYIGKLFLLHLEAGVWHAAANKKY